MSLETHIAGVDDALIGGLHSAVVKAPSAILLSAEAVPSHLNPEAYLPQIASACLDLTLQTSRGS